MSHVSEQEGICVYRHEQRQFSSTKQRLESDVLSTQPQEKNRAALGVCTRCKNTVADCTWEPHQPCSVKPTKRWICASSARQFSNRMFLPREQINLQSRYRSLYSRRKSVGTQCMPQRPKQTKTSSRRRNLHTMQENHRWLHVGTTSALQRNTNKSLNLCMNREAVFFSYVYAACANKFAVAIQVSVLTTQACCNALHLAAMNG